MARYTYKDIGPFYSTLVRMGNLPAFGVRDATGHYSWFPTLEEAFAELKEANLWEVNSYKRACPGRDHALRLKVLIDTYDGYLNDLVKEA
tara:strand:+ start:162 stop:431 length:270 start_codon:yes stop_codon:yes gene_type:complete